MRKNKMMRLASGLLVATLLTTSMISGTFAKYVTSADGTDTARVAKFGVTITANGETFANAYDATAAEDAKTVVGTANAKVVAPGTSGEMAKMTLTGTPEVKVKVSYAGEFALNEKWSVGNTFYCPLVITVKTTEGTTTINGGNYQSANEFAKAVNDAIAAYSAEYAANTDLSKQGTDSLTVSWSWPFDSDDTKDTALGKAAADNAADAGTVTLKVTTTVTQID